MSGLEPGALVAGRYRIERLLGRGGMGSVHIALDEKFGERVALKIAAAAGAAHDQFRARFAREARIGGRLGRTPGFVRAIDWGELPDGVSLYLAMDLVENAKPLDLESGERGERLGRLLTVVRLVAEAHRQGVLHRDLKPANVLQAADGSIHLTDFGLAKAGAEDDPQEQAAPLTQTGIGMGTPVYMAPEQFDDAKSVDGRADVYSLGVMLFRALTGKFPYASRDVRRLWIDQEQVRQGKTPLPRPRIVDPSVPPALDSLCAHAIAIKRDDRLTIGAFVTGLEDALATAEFETATPGAAPPPPPPPVLDPLEVTTRAATVAPDPQTARASDDSESAALAETQPHILTEQGAVTVAPPDAGTPDPSRSPRPAPPPSRPPNAEVEVLPRVEDGVEVPCLPLLENDGDTPVLLAREASVTDPPPEARLVRAISGGAQASAQAPKAKRGSPGRRLSGCCGLFLIGLGFTLILVLLDVAGIQREIDLDDELSDLTGMLYEVLGDDVARTLDTTHPRITIFSPFGGWTTKDSVSVRFQVVDVSLRSIEVAGVSQSVSPGSYRTNSVVDVRLETLGRHEIDIVALDVAGNRGFNRTSILRLALTEVVFLDSPSVSKQPNYRLRCRLNANITNRPQVTVNGKECVLSGQSLSADVALRPGQNKIRIQVSQWNGEVQDLTATVTYQASRQNWRGKLRDPAKRPDWGGGKGGK